MSARYEFDRTEIFEQVVGAIVEKGRVQEGELRAMFCRGPEDLVEATLRNFPV